MTEAMSFYSKWNEVVKAAAYVQQTGRNAHHKYNYVTERDLLDAIRPTMTALGLLFFLVNTEIVPEATGGPLVTIRTTYRVLDVHTGEYQDIVVMGQGSDSQDKGIYKAHTGARKYALRQFTLIATGDEPEEDQDSLDTVVKNRNAIVVIRKLRSIGLEPNDERLTVALGGDRIIDIPNDEAGNTILRWVYAMATRVENSEMEVSEMFERMTNQKKQA